MQAQIRSLAHWGGGIVSLLCLCFLAYRLWPLLGLMSTQTDWSQLTIRMLSALCIYLFASLLLAATWWLALRCVGQHAIGFREATAGHLSAQLAKYLPGNIFHFAVRHADARKHGGGHRGVASAAIVESMLLVIAALAWAWPLSDVAIPAQLRWLTALKPLLISALVLVVLATLVWALRKNAAAQGVTLRRTLAFLAASMIGYALFFFFFGLSFQALLAPGIPVIPFMALTGSVTLSWLGGFIVPGSPGGLGVRETLLGLLLAPWIGQSSAVLCAIAFRIVTMAGDLLMTLVGYSLKASRPLDEV